MSVLIWKAAEMDKTSSFLSSLFSHLVASELAKTGILGPQNTKGIGMFEDTTKATTQDNSWKVHAGWVRPRSLAVL